MERVSDVLAVVVIAICVVRGYWRGFYGALLSVMGFVGGYAAIYFFSKPAGEYLLAAGYVRTQTFAGISGSLLVFLAVSLSVSVLAAFVSKFLEPEDDGGFVVRFYRLGGAGVGLLSGAFYAAVFVLVALFIRAGYSESHGKKFEPSLSEQTAARAAAGVLERVLDKPDKAESPAVGAFYAVVSDPERGMSRLKDKLAEQAKDSLPKDLDPRVIEALKNPEIRKLQRKFN